jgi:superfamily II DNA or RNA helicase
VVGITNPDSPRSWLISTAGPRAAPRDLPAAVRHQPSWRPSSGVRRRVAEHPVEHHHPAAEGAAGLSIASAYFNVAGYEQIADRLDRVGRVRLLLGAEPTDAALRFTVRRLTDLDSPSPHPEADAAAQRHAHALIEDRNLLGFTRQADAGARRLVDWLRRGDVEVRRLERDFLHGKAYLINGGHPSVIAGSSNFTAAGLLHNRELNLGVYDPHVVGQVERWFDEQWAEAVPYDLAALYESRWLAHSPRDIFLRMLYELYRDELDQAEEHRSELRLTAFQRDGVWRAKRILRARGGVIIADEVGLGKTYLAGELIYQASVIRRQRVLVIASATLRDSTWRPFLDQQQIFADVVSYEELVTQLDSAGASGSTLRKPDDYALIVVDEAHHLRNAATQRADAMRRLLGGSVAKDLVLMTATPVNNGLADLRTLISYITPSDTAFVDIDIPSVAGYFARAMAVDPDELSGEHLFDLLDAVAVRRTRRFIKTQYPNVAITLPDGLPTTITFPDPSVIRVEYRLDDLLPGFFDVLATALGAHAKDEASATTGVILDEPGAVLTMARYVPSVFLRGGPGAEQYQVQNAGLLRSALLKRFESSTVAFTATLAKMIASHDHFLSALDSGYVLTGDSLRAWAASDTDDIAAIVATTGPDGFAPATLYDVPRLREAVQADRDLLHSLQRQVGPPDHAKDPKIAALVQSIVEIARAADTDGTTEQDRRDKRKVLVFTYFADTADYIHQALKERSTTDDRLAAYQDRIVLATGSDQAGRRNAIVGFAPRTAGRPGDEDRYDLAVATDVLSEGVNLQQARHIVNYDLPWNPMRLVQRYGRVDRIGSPHRRIFLRCFFPDHDLEKLLNLEDLLQRKLKQAAAAFGTGIVLPGTDAVERVMSETRGEIDALRREDPGLFEDTRSASASSEEFQRRLARAFESDLTRRTVLDLPWGAGTGMVRAGSTPGVVFCARVADHRRPYFRYVPLDTATLSVTTLDGEPAVSNSPVQPVVSNSPVQPAIVRELLACLDVADPHDDAARADLSDSLREAAFDAWIVARADIHAQWMRLTDPANLEAPVPRVMLRAADLVRQAGAGLGDGQDLLVARLNQAMEPRIQRAIRAILDSGDDEAVVVTELAKAADDLRITAPQQIKPYPEIDLEDVRLICWIAVHPGDQVPAA